VRIELHVVIASRAASGLAGLRPTVRRARPAARLRYSQKMQIPIPAA